MAEIADHDLGLLKRRRRVYTWRGCGIGLVVGVLVFGAVYLWASHASYTDAGDATGFLIFVLGAPGWFVLELLSKLLVAILREFGASNQGINAIVAVLMTYMSIPLSFAGYGLGFGWMSANSENASHSEYCVRFARNKKSS